MNAFEYEKSRSTSVLDPTGTLAFLIPAAKAGWAIGSWVHLGGQAYVTGCEVKACTQCWSDVQTSISTVCNHPSTSAIQCAQYAKAQMNSKTCPACEGVPKAAYELIWKIVIKAITLKMGLK